MTDRGGAAHGLAGDYAGRCKAALEPAPGDSLPVQQIADIVIVESAVRLKAGLVGAAAIIVNRVGIADDGIDRSKQRVACSIAERLESADGMRLPRGQVERAWGRGPA